MPDALTRTDGRWGRILRTLHADGPLSFDEMFPRVRDREHSYKTDRQKCFNAIWGMRREGLVEGDQLRLAITDLGRTTFAAVAEREAQLARDGFRVRLFPASPAKLALVAAAACVALAATGHAHARDLTPSDLRTIERINQARNRQGAAAAAGEPVGPCNWYAVNKAIDLIHAGYGPGEVAIAEVTTETGEDHAIAVVKDTVKGRPVTIVLDNRFNWTAERQDLEAIGYRWSGVEFTR